MFLRAYRRNRREANAVALEASLVAVELRRFMDSHATWDGTASDLLRELNQIADEDVRRTKEWPKTGRGLSGKIRRLAPALRRSSIQVEFDRSSDPSRTRTVTLSRTRVPADTEGANDRPDRPDRPDSDGSDGSDGSLHTPSPSRRVRAFGPPEGDGSPQDVLPSTEADDGDDADDGMQTLGEADRAGGSSWDRDQLVRIVREVAEANDQNLFAAALELNERGVPTPGGESVWTAVLVERVLMGRF